MPVSRRACDRCHSQKLRCPRNNRKNNDSCFRCLNAGALCVYSAPLPTGRPTTNRCVTEKHAVPAAIISGRPDPLVDTSIWTASDTSYLPQPWIPADTNYPWYPNLLDLDSSFDPGVITGASLVAEPECANATHLATTHLTETHNASHTSFQEPLVGSLPSLWSPPSDTDTTETCVNKLSDLSVRLYLVYKTSCKIAAAQNEFPGALLSSLAFETVTTYLQEGNTLGKPVSRGCKALDELFSATRSLLDILHDMDGSTVTSSAFNLNNVFAAAEMESESPKSIPWSEDSPLSAFFSISPQLSTSSPSRRNTCLVESTPSGAPQIEISAGGRPLPLVGAPGPDGVVLHLILACYTRLLHIYHNLIMALHRDAVQLREIELRSQSSLSELRLVLFVQLITHLLDRLRKAMADCLSLLVKKIRTNHTTVVTGTTSQMGASELNVNEGWLGDVFKLERNVGHELQQLQKKSQNL